MEEIGTKNLYVMHLDVSPYTDEPQNDMLQRLMDCAQGDEKDIRALVLRILTINFAAIHTSSMVTP